VVAIAKVYEEMMCAGVRGPVTAACMAYTYEEMVRQENYQAMFELQAIQARTRQCVTY
jgi:hypothetical protein